MLISNQYSTSLQSFAIFLFITVITVISIKACIYKTSQGTVSTHYFNVRIYEREYDTRGASDDDLNCWDLQGI